MRGRDIELSVGKDRLGPMQAGFKAVGLGHVFLGQATAVRYRKTLAQSLAEARAALGSNPLLMLGSIFSPLVDNFPQKYKHGTKLSSSRQAKQPEQSSDRHDMCLHATQVSPLTKMMMMMMM